MNEIKIGNITIGENRPTVIIAEVTCEHRGNIDSAKRLIRAAKEAGAFLLFFIQSSKAAYREPEVFRRL